MSEGDEVRSVWKYELAVVHGVQTLRMPAGAKVLTLQLQNGKPTIWMEVDTEEAREDRAFQMHGTGWDWHEGDGRTSAYVGTVQIGEFVWHFYELVTP